MSVVEEAGPCLRGALPRPDVEKTMCCCEEAAAHLRRSIAARPRRMRAAPHRAAASRRRPRRRRGREASSGTVASAGRRTAPLALVASPPRCPPRLLGRVAARSASRRADVVPPRLRPLSRGTTAGARGGPQLAQCPTDGAARAGATPARCLEVTAEVPPRPALAAPIVRVEVGVARLAVRSALDRRTCTPSSSCAAGADVCLLLPARTATADAGVD